MGRIMEHVWVVSLACEFGGHEVHAVMNGDLPQAQVQEWAENKWRAMRHGIESRNEEIMSVEQAKTRCPDILREAMNNIVCKIEGENDD